MSDRGSDHETRPARLRGFYLGLAACTAVGLAVRLVYVLAVRHGDPVTGDGNQFHLLAKLLVEKHRYLSLGPYYLHGQLVPTAEKPPLYPFFLGVVTKLGGNGFTAQQVVMCVLGATAIVAIGLVGRRAGGPRVGLVAAALAAVYPMLFVLDGSLRSESLYVPLIAFSLLAAYRLIERPTLGRASVLGLLIGLAALTRSEAVLLLLLLALPVIWKARGVRLRLIAAVLAGFLVLVAPWLTRNWITFNRPTAISTNEGGLLAGANCDLAYYGPKIGTWPCFPQVPDSWGTNEAVISSRLRKQAYRYARDHARRVPVVVGVRVLRTWDVFEPWPQSRLEARVNDRDVNVEKAGVVSLYVLALLSVYGLVILRRRGAPLAPLVAPIVLVTFVGATSYGETRFRAAAEVSLVALAAVALTTLYERR